MRRVTLLVLGLLATLSPVWADDAVAPADACSKEVFAAFEKQRTSKAFRVAMTQPTAEGPVQMTVDYLPPDRMLQTVVGAHMPGEQQTMLVGDRAFAGTSGAYEELLPQYTQSIISEVQTAIGAPPKIQTAFDCLGKVTFEGKEFVAYRTSDKAEPDPSKALARTLYVDPATGLPYFNVVAAISGTEEPVMKATYSYPSDLVIEAPVGAPVQKAH